MKTAAAYCNYRNLYDLLQNANSLNSEEKVRLRYYIDNHDDCWRIWNKVRWDAAMESNGVKELKEYFGENFAPYHDSSWALSREWNSKSRKTKQSIENFYKNTSNFIYNSIIFYESGNRINLEKYFDEIASRYKIQSVTDFGCGVGNDGLMMLNKGFKVNFIDFESPTLNFLRWRVKKRQISKGLYTVTDLSSNKSQSKSDMFWSIDVIEHMVNPKEIFSYIFDSTKVVVYFTDADDKAGGRHPFHFKIKEEELEEEFISRGYTKVNHEVLNIWEK